jgi:hypothetical protein
MAVDFEEEALDGRDVSLASLFQVCGPLKSLHIHHLHGLANFPYKVLADNICASGEHLKLLSLGMFNDADLVAYDPINDQEFDRVCRACTNLQQLSYQLLEEVYILPDSNDNYNKFMISQADFSIPGIPSLIIHSTPSQN